MDINAILKSFHQNKSIAKNTIDLIQNDRVLRTDLVNYFISNKDREFAVALLQEFIEIRKQPDGNMPFEDLMLACYVLGLHNNVEDCLKIWDAKIVDFDTYCGLDIQLVAFAGFSETVGYLEALNIPEAKKAFDYLSECKAAGDFDPDYLNEYFSVDALPWYI